MIARNIHLDITDEEEAPSALPEAAPAERPLPRLRDVTNDPLREYRSRPGAVRPLPDSVASLILSKKGRCIVENHQIVASIDGVERAYSSRDSVVIAELNGKGVKVLWFANRRKTDCIHLFSNNGTYLETLPLKQDAQWFSNDAVSQEAMAAAVSHRKRDARRLGELHAPDIAAAAAREAHNGREIAAKVREDERIVRTFAAPEAPSASGERAPAGAFAKADRFCAVEAAVERARGVIAEQATERNRLANEAVSFADFRPGAEAEEEPTSGEALSPSDFLP